MSDLPLIDTAILDDLIEAIGLDPLRPVVELFLGEAQRLSAVIAAGDPEAARRAAHSLKSSAGQLGAAALSEAAAAVERAAESGAPFAQDAATLARLAEATTWALKERMRAS